MLEAEKWHYHSYDYAFRRVYLYDDKNPSSIDPERVWYDRRLVDAAEAIFRRPVRAKPQITPADEAEARGDYEAAALYRRQDRERAAANARITVEKLPNGEWSPEVLEYVDLCMLQVRANVERFTARNAAWRTGGRYEEDRDALRRVQDLLGLKAREEAAQ